LVSPPPVKPGPSHRHPLLMPIIYEYIPFLILFFSTFVVVLGLIPILSKVARKYGLVDNPDQHRKLHKNAIPLIGGISIFYGVILVYGILLLFFPTRILLEDTSPSDALQFIGLLVASILILVVGVIDDRFGIRGRQKLCFQILAALILVGSGTWISSVELFGAKLDYQDSWSQAATQRVGKKFDEIDSEHASQDQQIAARVAGGDLSEDLANAQKSRIKAKARELKSTYSSQLMFNRILAIAGVVFTVLWIVGAINAVNLIDGADGLAGTTCLIVSSVLAIMAVYTGDLSEAGVAISLAGGILGFLIFNFPPAKIFLGDAGSMLIGLVLAALAVQSFLKEAILYVCIAPLAMMFVPIFDSATAFIRRLATGRSIYATDRGHLHHMLMRHGLTNRGMVFFVGGLTTVTAVGAVLTVINKNPTFSIIGVCTVVVFLISAKVFAFAEFRLVCNRLYRFLRSFLVSRKSGKTAHSSTVQLQGSKEWHKLWEGLTDFGERHRCHRIKLDLNLPWLHESFHADWSLDSSAEKDEVWKTRLPLAAKGRVYGRIDITGGLSEEPTHMILLWMSDLLETLEPAIARLAEAKEDPAEIQQMLFISEQEPHHKTIPAEANEAESTPLNFTK
jgi:UDP-N-acetylmuramyl pentapeptide phosphotransferase/UDP-N-acetylglucosamine-1-phosphate transferase